MEACKNCGHDPCQCMPGTGQLKRFFCNYSGCTLVIGYGAPGAQHPSFCRWHRLWVQIDDKTGLDERTECEEWQRVILAAYPDDKHNPVWGGPFLALWLRLRQAVK